MWRRGIACGGHGAHRRTVVGAIAGEDFEAFGVAARQFDGVLVGVRPAEGEQDLAEFSAGSHVCHRLARQRADFGRHARRGVGQFGGLLLHGPDDALVAMPDIDAHRHRIEIQIALFVNIPKIYPFARLTAIGLTFAWADQV